MAAILFADVVGYSKMRNQRQKQIGQLLNEHCLKELLPAFRYQRLNISDKPTISAMPTGDGIVVCLEPFQGELNEGLILLKLAISLQKLGEEQTDNSIKSPIEFRIGIHTGILETIEDINVQRNFCGHSINIAQRIMDLGDGNHILCSEDAYRSYFQDLKFLLPKDVIKFKELNTTYRVKHGVELKIRNIYYKNPIEDAKFNPDKSETSESNKNTKESEIGNPKILEINSNIVHEFGNNKDPEHKRYFKVISSEHSKLLNHFYTSKQLLVIGIINVEVLDALKSIHSNNNENKPDWEKIYVLFPINDKFENIPQPTSSEGVVTYLSQKENNKSEFESLAEDFFKEGVDIKTGEYSFLPTVGIIAGDYKGDEGKIQINYYLWGDVVTLKPTLWSMTVILDKKEDRENYEKFEKYIDFVITQSTLGNEYVKCLIPDNTSS